MMKDLIFKIIKDGYYVNFYKQKLGDIMILEITDGHAGELHVIKEEMPDDELLKLINFQYRKLKHRLTNKL